MFSAMGEAIGDCVIVGSISFAGIIGIKGVRRGDDRGKLVITGGTAGIIFGELTTAADCGLRLCLERLRPVESSEADGRCRVLRGLSEAVGVRSCSFRVIEGGREPSLVEGASWDFFKCNCSRMKPMKRFLRTHFPTLTVP